MVESFVLENLTLSKKVSFGMDTDYEYILSEIDWGTAQADHNTYSYPNQMGVIISSTQVKDRDVSIIGYVTEVLSKELINQLGHTEALQYVNKKILEKKSLLNKMINPLDYIKITIGNYYIEGKAYNPVKYGKIESENNEYFCKFAIDIYCNNPMFKKQTEIKTILSGSTPIFHFPLILKPSGIVMSTRKNYQLLVVDNEGDVSIGGKIIFKAKGNVKNPTVENVATGEVLTINKTMEAGEKIIVNTVDGESKGIFGYIGDIESNYFKYWDYDNDWIKFPVGSSLIGYSTANGTENMLDVSIELNPEKFNVEEM